MLHITNERKKAGEGHMWDVWRLTRGDTAHETASLGNKLQENIRTLFNLHRTRRVSDPSSKFV